MHRAFFSGIAQIEDFEAWYWERARVLAATFHFQPSEIEALSITKLQKWIEQANVINEK